MMNNIMKTIFILLIFLLIAGCTTNSPPSTDNPKELFLYYQKLARSLDEYSISYNVDTSTPVYFYKKGDATKTVVEVSGFDAKFKVSNYKLKTPITCEDYPEFQGYINCMEEFFGHETYRFILNRTYGDLTSLKDFDVKYIGSGNIIGRDCDIFNLTLKNLSSFEGKDTLLIYGQRKESYMLLTWIDKQTGLVLHMMIIDGPTYELEAGSFSDQVSDDVFKLPASFDIVIYTRLNDEYILLIESFEDISGPVKILGRDKDNKTLEVSLPSLTLKPFSTKIVNFTFDSTKLYAMCIGAECAPFDSGYSSRGTCLKYSLAKETCNSNGLCKWQDFPSKTLKGYCFQKQCYEHTDSNVCALDSDCTWIDGCIAKTEACKMLKNGPECQTSSFHCIWDRGYCIQDSCFIFPEESDCISSKRNCEWRNGACLTKI